MKNRNFNLILFYGLLLNTLACSTYHTIETNTQNKLNLSGNQEGLNTFNLNCELLSIIINPSEELVFPLKDAHPTLHLSDGKYRGFSVCNSFFGKYTKEGNAIKFTGATTTMMNCIGNYGFVEPLSGSELENLISSKLSATNNFSIEKNKLILKKDSNILMVYRIND
nr:META domain-containing protein [uncultured Carboxylicivirga sp.]